MSLLDKGPEFNAMGGRYGTGLGAAARSVGREIVKILLDQVADVHKADEDFGNVLEAAACGGSKEIVQMLLAQDAKIHVLGLFFLAH